MKPVHAFVVFKNSLAVTILGVLCAAVVSRSNAEHELDGVATNKLKCSGRFD